MQMNKIKLRNIEIGKTLVSLTIPIHPTHTPPFLTKYGHH